MRCQDFDRPFVFWLPVEPAELFRERAIEAQAREDSLY
jgi:hypothetical protein